MVYFIDVFIARELIIKNIAQTAGNLVILHDEPVVGYDDFFAVDGGFRLVRSGGAESDGE